MCRTVVSNENSRAVFYLLFAMQLSGVHIISWLFVCSFRSFIDFVSHVSFATSSFIFYINHTLMFSDGIPQTIRLKGKESSSEFY
jgi:hypothetical protein